MIALGDFSDGFEAMPAVPPVVTLRAASMRVAPLLPAERAALDPARPVSFAEIAERWQCCVKQVEKCVGRHFIQPGHKKFVRSGVLLRLEEEMEGRKW